MALRRPDAGAWQRIAKNDYVWPEEKFVARLRNPLNEDNATNSDMNVDGSITPVEFVYTVPAGKVVFIQRTVGYLLEPALQPQAFGAVTLTNGIEIEIRNQNDEVVHDPLNNYPIIDLADFSNLSGTDLTRDDSGVGTAPDVIRFRQTESFDAGSPGTTALPWGYSIVWRINDDLSGINEFHVTIKGRISDATYTQDTG